MLFRSPRRPLRQGNRHLRHARKSHRRHRGNAGNPAPGIPDDRPPQPRLLRHVHRKGPAAFPVGGVEIITRRNMALFRKKSRNRVPLSLYSLDGSHCVQKSVYWDLNASAALMICRFLFSRGKSLGVSRNSATSSRLRKLCEFERYRPSKTSTIPFN